MFEDRTYWSLKFIKFQDVVRKIESNPTDNKDRPIQAVKIADARVIAVDTPFAVTKEGVYA